MAFKHPDGSPLERLMRYLNDNGGSAELSSLGRRIQMSDQTLRRAVKEATAMGLISASVSSGQNVTYVVRPSIGQPTPAERRAQAVQDAREALRLAMEKLADLDAIERGGAR